MPGDDLTHGPPATKKAGGSHHRFGRINRHSLRDGLRLISRSPRGPGFLAPVIPEKLASQELDLSVGRPGPRDFAVRFSHVRLTCHPRPSHPCPTCRDDRAYVPLHRGRMRERIVVICPTPQAPIRAADWHDGQFPHRVHAGVSCRRRRDAPSSILSIHNGGSRSALRATCIPSSPSTPTSTAAFRPSIARSYAGSKFCEFEGPTPMRPAKVCFPGRNGH
jgi:hypothetical protein